MIVSPRTATDVSNGDADKMFPQFWKKRYTKRSDGDRRLVERVEGSEVILAGDAERTPDSVAHQRVGENLSVCFAPAPRRSSRNVLRFGHVPGLPCSRCAATRPFEDAHAGILDMGAHGESRGVLVARFDGFKHHDVFGLHGS